MTLADIIIRAAQPSDLAAIADIYHYYITHSTCTFDTEHRPPDQWRKWFEDHSTPSTPAIVAASNGCILGWGSLSRWNNRCAYRFSVEDSVYVHHDRHRKGIGKSLLENLIATARRAELRSIVAQIAGDQPASERLHQQFGFRRVGTLERIGFKFDRWIDVSIWQLHLVS